MRHSSFGHQDPDIELELAKIPVAKKFLHLKKRFVVRAGKSELISTLDGETFVAFSDSGRREFQYVAHVRRDYVPGDVLSGLTQALDRFSWAYIRAIEDDRTIGLVLSDHQAMVAGFIDPSMGVAMRAGEPRPQTIYSRDGNPILILEPVWRDSALSDGVWMLIRANPILKEFPRLLEIALIALVAGSMEKRISFGA